MFSYKGLGRKFEERLMCRKEPRNVSPALQMAQPSPATPDKGTNYKMYCNTINFLLLQYYNSLPNNKKSGENEWSVLLLSGTWYTHMLYNGFVKFKKLKSGKKREVKKN